jgi:hypothetical protein
MAGHRRVTPSPKGRPLQKRQRAPSGYLVGLADPDERLIALQVWATPRDVLYWQMEELQDRADALSVRLARLEAEHPRKVEEIERPAVAWLLRDRRRLED